MELASLILAIFTLGLAVLIHSETRDALSQINLIAHTLPGTCDVKRCLDDMEKSGEQRARIVCDAPKTTHLAFTPSGQKVSRFRWAKKRLWGAIRKAASCCSGDIVDESVVQVSSTGKWEIKFGSLRSKELDDLLTGGWEPFSITPDSQVWVRKWRGQAELGAT